jgi:uncharacterized membrane protein YdjX (TVP38/TMEM64 family)
VTARRWLGGLWLVTAAGALYAYLAHRAWLHDLLARVIDQPPALAIGVLIVLGALRGFTFIPSTMLVLAALPFVAPGPLLVATLAGIAISSSAIYAFAGALGLEGYYEARHGAALARLKTLLSRYEVPVVVSWSFFPLVPTDAICCVCGVMRVRFLPFLLSVTAGEGAICALYIYGGDHLLRWLRLR